MAKFVLWHVLAGSMCMCASGVQGTRECAKGNTERKINKNWLFGWVEALPSHIRYICGQDKLAYATMHTHTHTDCRLHALPSGSAESTGNQTHWMDDVDDDEAKWNAICCMFVAGTGTDGIVCRLYKNRLHQMLWMPRPSVRSDRWRAGTETKMQTDWVFSSHRAHTRLPLAPRRILNSEQFVWRMTTDEAIESMIDKTPIHFVFYSLRDARIANAIRYRIEFKTGNWK